MSKVMITFGRIFTCVLLITICSSALLASELQGNAVGIQRGSTIWLETSDFNLSSIALQDQLLSSGASRVVLPILEGGMTIESFQNVPFRGMLVPPTSVKTVNNFIKRAHDKGVTVWFSVDCFHWVLPQNEIVSNLFDQYPDLLEITNSGLCGLPGDGKYASPFNPEVKQKIINVVLQFARDHAGIDGLVIDAHLAPGVILGYSAASRLAYLRVSNIDPIDLQLSGSAEQMDRTQRWVDWRLKSVTEFVSDIVRGFRANCPRGGVAVVGRADFYRVKMGSRNTGLTDWLSWSSAGGVDEVWLTNNWRNVDRDQSLFRADKELISRVKLKTRAIIAVEATDKFDTKLEASDFGKCVIVCKYGGERLSRLLSNLAERQESQ